MDNGDWTVELSHYLLVSTACGNETDATGCLQRRSHLGLISLSTPPEPQRPLAVDVPAAKSGPKPKIDAHIRLSKSPHLIDYDGVQRQCEYCAITKKKQRTTFYCDNCPGKPHLCPKGCFKKFHTQKDL